MVESSPNNPIDPAKVADALNVAGPSDLSMNSLSHGEGEEEQDPDAKLADEMLK